MEETIQFILENVIKGACRAEIEKLFKDLEKNGYGQFSKEECKVFMK